MARILIADDNRTTTRALCTLVERWGYDSASAFDGREALAVLEAQQVDLVLTDLRMPEIDGMELLRQIAENWPDITVIVGTAYGSIEVAVEAMKLGAFDFLTKPYDNAELRAKLSKAAAQRAMVVEIERMNARLASIEADTQRGTGEIIGTSQAMARVYEEVRKVAVTDSTVLLLGESGTGKEIVAREIHARSGRSAGPFVPVYCAAFAEGLLESELFGHERGAFTSAVARKIGRLELADGGTLFLDEIGEIPTSLQVKLLRVLQEREFERVGGTQTLHFDCRIIAATNRDLEAAIREGAFREDLYYRLNVFALELPPLRNRKEDIAALVEEFCRQQAQRVGRTGGGLTARALEAMMGYEWPGNVRELQNVVERAMILAADRPADLDDLPVSMSTRTTTRVSIPQGDVHFDEELERFERQLILTTYERCDRVKARTAKTLGIDRNRLRYKLKKFGIDD